MVVQDEDLEKVAPHDVRHPDEAHHHGAGQAEGLVQEEEGRDPERSDQQHSFVVEIEIICNFIEIIPPVQLLLDISPILPERRR